MGVFRRDEGGIISRAGSIILDKYDCRLFTFGSNDDIPIDHFINILLS